MHDEVLGEALILKLTRLSSYLVPFLIIAGTVLSSVAILFQPTSHGFVLKAQHTFASLNITAYLYQHITLKCQFLHIESSDDHNFFATTFRTTPTDNSGVFNVIKKMVEDGSQEFPVTNLYGEMKKRSIANTFQAEYSDEWTSYHLSTTNNNDFFNLLRVQLDSVFHPLLTQEQFWTKCHRLEFDTIDDVTTPLHHAGVAYAEASGANQKATTMFSNGIKQELYRDTILKNQFIGLPESIKDLTLETVIEVHGKYYHPSNALFFHYGSISKELLLKTLSNVISSYRVSEELLQEHLEVQERWKSPMTVTAVGPCEHGVASQKVKVALAWVAGDLMNVSDVVDLEFLSILLADSTVSPLYKGLIKPAIGTRFVSTGYFPKVRNPYFSVGIDGFDGTETDYSQLLLKIMTETFSTGFAAPRVQSLLNLREMKQKRISASQGHKYWSQIIRSWVHNVDPLSMLDVSWETERMLRLLAVQPKYFEMIMKQKIIDNRHRLGYVMQCSPTYLEEQIRKDKQELTETRAKMSLVGKQALVWTAQKLQERREAVNPVHVLPSINLDDLMEPKRPEIIQNDNVFVVPSLVNGIVYVDIKCTVPLGSYMAEDLRLLTYVFPYLGTATMSDDQFVEQQQLFTDGIRMDVKINYLNSGPPEACFVISAATLSRNLESLFTLLESMLTSPNLKNYGQIDMIMLQIAANYEQMLESTEMEFVTSFAKAGLSEAATLEDLWNVVSVTKRVAKIVKDNKLTSIYSSLAVVFNEVFRKSTFSAMIHCSQSDQDSVVAMCTKLLKQLNSESRPAIDRTTLDKAHTEAKTHSKVFFLKESQDHYSSAVAIPKMATDMPTLAASAVLTMLMQSEFLQVSKTDRDTIGIINGHFDEDSGIITFTTEHDKNPSLVFKTIETSLDKIALGEFTGEMLQRAKIQVIAAIDKPLAPSENGLHTFLTNPSFDQSEYRNQVKLVSRDNIMNMAKLAKTLHHRYACIGPSQESVIPPGFEIVDVSLI